MCGSWRRAWGIKTTGALAATISKGGEIFVLKMGASVKIIEMAKSLVMLSGLEPGKDIEIKVTGLKPTS